MRSPRARFSARALRVLPCRAPGGLQLQAARVLPQLRRAAHGRKRGAARRRGVSRAAGAAVGAQRSVSLALSVRQPPRNHGRGAGHRLPRHRHASRQAGRLQCEARPHRRGDADPALWQCAQSQPALPHAVPRRGVRRAPRRLALVPLGEGAHRRRAHRPGEPHRRARGPFSGTPRPARTRSPSSPCLSELALEDEPMEALLAHSITYRIAVGPRAGRKVFTLQSLPAGDEGSGAAAGKVGGFSLHAGVAARADEREQARAAVPLHQPPGGVGGAPVAHPRRPGALPAQDALPRRHHARGLRAAGFPRAAGRAGAQTASQSHPLPRRVRPEQRPPGAGDQGRAGPRRKTPGGQTPRPSAGRR